MENTSDLRGNRRVACRLDAPCLPHVLSLHRNSHASHNIVPAPVADRLTFCSFLQVIQSSDDYMNAMAQHSDKLVVVKFYDQFCRACDEIRPRFEDMSRSVSEDVAVFYQLEVCDTPIIGWALVGVKQGSWHVTFVSCRAL